ncbi:polysaccharide deacetylase family protein [Alloalcanivorax mobilis]|uniref:polysaccharide deacetylase family protein n=1 Tax=Alloalcanivorax mobilis TaxID=2019569 RepID=UPI000C78910A|nr:polysaccharide deacetylase family protein [Alloalcanivorax mobilis]
MVMSVLRGALKSFSYLLTAFKKPCDNIVFLMYHRVTGDVNLELDLPFELFEKQMAVLSEGYEVISFDVAIEHLQARRIPPSSRPRVVITFDDAYEDFYDKALPVLEKYSLPAALYVPTSFIDNPGEAPVSVLDESSALLKPMSWDMLREVQRNHLITLAAHSHGHQEYSSLSPEAIKADVAISAGRIADELGVSFDHFAYPRGRWNEVAEATVRPFYKTITLVGGAGVSPSDFDPYRIPRVPVIRSDGFFWFSARIRGRLVYEQKILNLVKGILNASRR